MKPLGAGESVVPRLDLQIHEQQNKSSNSSVTMCIAADAADHPSGTNRRCKYRKAHQDTGRRCTSLYETATRAHCAGNQWVRVLADSCCLGTYNVTV